MLQSLQAVRQKILLEEVLKNELTSSWVSACMSRLLQRQTELMNASYLPKRHCRWGRMKWDRSAHLTNFVPGSEWTRTIPDTALANQHPRFLILTCGEKGLFTDFQVPIGSNDSARI